MLVQGDKKEESNSQANGQSPEAQQKIKKFAKMLKTLNGYKSQYKSAKTEEEKTKIHDQVLNFTQKWLDSKNLQLASMLLQDLQPPSENAM